MKYTETKPSSEEAELARLANEVFATRLGLRELVDLTFISPSAIGEIIQANPIAGLTRNRKVYIVTGQTPRDLLKTIAHEVEHVRQFDRFETHNAEQQERAARLFEYELSCEFRGQSFDELWCELIRKKCSSRLTITARPTVTKPKPTQPPVVRQVSHPPSGIVSNRMFETTSERISYIRDLLAKLPDTPAYRFQRANLQLELAERLTTQ